MKRVGRWASPKGLIQFRYLGISVLLMAVFSGCLSINLTPKMGPLKEKTLSGTGGDKVLLVDGATLSAAPRANGKATVR